MKIKKFTDYDRIDGFDIYQSAVIGYNKLDKDKIQELLSDYNKFITPEKYIDIMTKLICGQEFVKFIELLDKEKDIICVIGDYDCDGIFATVIMVYGLMLCGFNVIFTISDRFEDGYGMHNKQVDIGLSNGATVFITVDNGITANDVIDYIHSKGAKCVVTDHHTPQGENKADLCIDPLYNDDEFKGISGACVAFKLIYELQKKYNFDVKILKDFLCLAYITTYSDQMPILGENRWLVQAGERYFNNSLGIDESIGGDGFITRLADMLDFYTQEYNTDNVLMLTSSYKQLSKATADFDLIPKINAINRVLGDVTDLPYDIMCLFSSEYSGIPHFYSGINQKRKYMKTELLNKHKKVDGRKAIVECLQPDLWDDNYSGIAGLVASEAVESENIPALIGVDRVGTTDDSVMTFSGRTPAGFNLFNALTEIKTEHPDLHLNFGGHAEALGASCLKKEIPLLEQYLGEKFELIPQEDVEVVYFEVTDYSKMLDTFGSLWPFGNGFEFPKLHIKSKIDNLDFHKLFLSDSRLKNVPIQYYFKEDDAKLHVLQTKNVEVEFILSFSYDEWGNAILKLDKILS